LAIIWGNFPPILEDWNKIIENNFPAILEDWNKIIEKYIPPIREDWDKIIENNFIFFLRIIYAKFAAFFYIIFKLF
jgi:hypothetical protein